MDLKRILMEVGNALVLDHKFEPAAVASQGLRPNVGVGPGPHHVRIVPVHEIAPTEKTTSSLAALTEFFNAHPEARAELARHGLEWSMPQPKPEWCKGSYKWGRPQRAAPAGDTYVVCSECQHEVLADGQHRAYSHTVTPH